MDFAAVLDSQIKKRKKPIKFGSIPPPKVSEFFLMDMSKQGKVVLVSKSTGRRFYGNQYKGLIQWRC